MDTASLAVQSSRVTMRPPIVVFAGVGYGCTKMVLYLVL